MRTGWTIVALVLALVAMGGLALQPEVIAGSQIADDPKEDKDDVLAKIQSAERKLPIAELKLDQAELQKQAGQSSAEAAVRQAEEELVIAKGKLIQYRDFDSKRKIEEASRSRPRRTEPPSQQKSSPRSS